MTDPIVMGSCIQCRILTQYHTTQMISLDYVSTFELGPFSANMPHDPSSFIRDREEGSIELKLALAPMKTSLTLSSEH